MALQYFNPFDQFLMVLYGEMGESERDRSVKGVISPFSTAIHAMSRTFARDRNSRGGSRVKRGDAKAASVVVVRRQDSQKL